MSKEATSFEAKVTGIRLNEDGGEWVEITYIEAVPKLDAPEPNLVPGNYLTSHIRASELPGVKLGDKVQVALYLK